LADFVEAAYLPWTKQERRASTSKGHQEIWRNYLRDRVGHLRVRDFRTVDANRLLGAIAKEKDLARTTLQHIKSALSTIFIYAKNEGAFDGAKPSRWRFASPERKRTGPNLRLRFAPSSPDSQDSSTFGQKFGCDGGFRGPTSGRTARARLERLRRNNIDHKSFHLAVAGQPPKTRASRDSVPVIRQLALILDEYRRSIGSPQVGFVFPSSDGPPINLDGFTRKVIQPNLAANRLPWHGWHAFRRGFASNLYAMGAQDILVQRILRHAKAHVTRDCYIKVFDGAVIAAMDKLQVPVEELEQTERNNHHQLEFAFAYTPRFICFESLSVRSVAQNHPICRLLCTNCAPRKSSLTHPMRE
jgi:integrase